MDLGKIKLNNGDVIRIKGVNYEVLYIQEDVDYLPNRDPPMRHFLLIYVHDHKTNTLFPTHLISYYLDSKETFWVEASRRSVGGSEPINSEEISVCLCSLI